MHRDSAGEDLASGLARHGRLSALEHQPCLDAVTFLAAYTPYSAADQNTTPPPIWDENTHSATHHRRPLCPLSVRVLAWQL